MAIRRKSSTAEAERPEQEPGASSNRPRPIAQPGEAERGGGAQQSAAGVDANARPGAPEPRPNGPVGVEPMAQNRNAAELEDRIRQRAYEIYEARGRQDGRADEDWLLAEEEITGITGGG
jgi:hypothetical protein